MVQKSDLKEVLKRTSGIEGHDQPGINCKFIRKQDLIRFHDSESECYCRLDDLEKIIQALHSLPDHVKTESCQRVWDCLRRHETDVFWRIYVEHDYQVNAYQAPIDGYLTDCPGLVWVDYDIYMSHYDDEDQCDDERYDFDFDQQMEPLSFDHLHDAHNYLDELGLSCIDTYEFIEPVEIPLTGGQISHTVYSLIPFPKQ